LSACARAPETISALTAAEIIKVLSIVRLMSSLFRQGKEAFLVREQLASTRVRSVPWNPISPTRNNVAPPLRTRPPALITEREQRWRAEQALTISTAAALRSRRRPNCPLNHSLSAHPINWPWRFRSPVAWVATGSSLTPKSSHDNPLCPKR
jgi:hypothetical protein